MNNFKIIANWKMNGSKEQVESWIDILSDNLESEDQSNCIFCPPVCYIDVAKDIILSKNLSLNLGSQNIDPDEDNPSTGGINGRMLKDIGCNYVLIGHSERRTNYNEDQDLLLKKLYSATKSNLRIIYCVGETIEEKERGLTKEIIKKQLEILKDFSHYSISIAYEPVWSIGKGITPSLNYIDEIHQNIKDELKSSFYSEENITISYGGSVTANNAVSISSLNSVDGLLIGGASLDAENFSGLVNSITR